MGAGRTEVPRLPVSCRQKKRFHCYKWEGKASIIPKNAIREGIGYLSEDRKRFGCIVDMTIANNTVITNP